jgi:CheY-like chemotaxis protein
MVIEEARKTCPDLPAVLCTGFADQIDDELAAARGVNRVVGKPVTVERLSRALRDVLDR